MERSIGRGHRVRKVVLWAIAVALALCALLAVYGIAVGDLDEGTWKIIGSTVGVAGYALLALPASLLQDHGRRRVLVAASFSACAVGLALWIAAIWSGFDGEVVARSLVVASAYAFAMTVWCAVSFADAGRGAYTLVLARTAVVLAFVAATMASLAAIAEIQDGTYYRVFTSITIVALLAVLLIPIMSRLARADATNPSGFTFRLVTEPGGERTVTVGGGNLADAIGGVVREMTRAGEAVTRIDVVASDP